jgi:hypothetical protein
MKIAICLIIKDENEYLQEWMDYHRKVGVSHFYIYDNNSKLLLLILMSLFLLTLNSRLFKKFGNL